MSNSDALEWLAYEMDEIEKFEYARAFKIVSNSFVIWNDIPDVQFEAFFQSKREKFRFFKLLFCLHNSIESKYVQVVPASFATE